jgi:hypothetical protein
MTRAIHEEKTGTSNRDCYETPAHCTHALLKSIDTSRAKHLNIVDPCAGQGSILAAVETYNDNITVSGLELRNIPPHEEGLCILAGVDALSNIQWHDPHDERTIVISNPPYSRIWDFVRKAIDECLTAYWLLDTSTLKKIPQDLRGYLDSVRVLTGSRPSFDGLGTDGAEYAWFEFGAHDEYRLRPACIVWLEPPTPAEIKRDNATSRERARNRMIDGY